MASLTTSLSIHKGFEEGTLLSQSISGGGIQWVRDKNRKIQVETLGGNRIDPSKVFGISLTTLSQLSNSEVVKELKKYDSTLTKITQVFQLTLYPTKSQASFSETNEQKSDLNDETTRVNLPSFPKIHCDPPTIPVAELYKNVKTSDEKRALLCYLEQYQQYNAWLTANEIEKLGYPPTLCSMQIKSGYVRTTNHLSYLLRPFIRTNLSSFFQGTDPLKYVDLSTPIALDALKLFCPNKNPQIINLTFDDLSSNVFNFLGKNGKGTFLFVLQEPSIDCALMWGAKVYPNNLKNRQFGKEAPQNFRLERMTIAGRQGVSEDENSEVKLTLLKEYDLLPRLPEMRKWYNGYQIGSCVGIYNPWSVLKYIQEKGNLAASTLWLCLPRFSQKFAQKSSISAKAGSSIFWLAPCFCIEESRNFFQLS